MQNCAKDSTKQGERCHKQLKQAADFLDAFGGMLVGEQLDAGLSLLFDAGDRPTAAGILKLLSGEDTAQTGFSVSHQPPEAEGWLQLLSSGLTFDLTGLSPASSAPMPLIRQFLGLPENLDSYGFEVLVLKPGLHLRGAAAMMPVVRVMVALASQLAEAFGARAVCWHPAECCMEARYFGRVAEDWLFGGPFPALGLTAIQERPDGGVESRGLTFFIGQEVQVEAQRREPTSETVKLAVRAIDYLVRNGPLHEPQQLDAPDGEVVTAEVAPGGKLVRVRRM